MRNIYESDCIQKSIFGAGLLTRVSYTGKGSAIILWFRNLTIAKTDVDTVDNIDDDNVDNVDNVDNDYKVSNRTLGPSFYCHKKHRQVKKAILPA